MRKTMTAAVITALVVVGAILLPSSALAAGGACGGGNTLSQAIKGWQKHGVLDDVARLTGQTPGVDGSAKAIVKAGIVKVRVAKGGWVKNSTCTGGRFKGLGAKKYIPAGAIYFVPEKDAPAKCKRKRTKVGWQGNCGNKQNGNLLVVRPCKKKPPKKPKPPKPTGKIVCSNTGQMVNSIDQCVVQTNTASQSCKAGEIWNGTQCTIVQVNNNCGNTSVGSGNNTASGDNCNVTNVCSNVNSPGGVVNCNTTPPPPTNNKPTCQEYKSPQHVYPGMGYDVQFSCSDIDGDPITLSVTAMRGKVTYVEKNGTLYTYHYSAVKADGSPLPPGDEVITVIATDSKGASSVPLLIEFPIPVDER